MTRLERLLASKGCQRQVAREQRAEQRKEREFESDAKRHGIKIRRQRHGRAKQMRKFRSQIVTGKGSAALGGQSVKQSE